MASQTTESNIRLQIGVNKRPRRQPGRAGRERRESDTARDGRNRGKTSLRLRSSGGKRGRSAEINARRGSLKRKDRSAEKAAKEEAAIERKTVRLPECVASLLVLRFCLHCADFA